MSCLEGVINKSDRQDKEAGFSLVELTFVVAIIAVVISTVVFTTQARLDVARIFTTKERMQIIVDSIARYVESYGHVPCPSLITAPRTDADYGWATGSNSGNCPQAIELYDDPAPTGTKDVVLGMVPINSLIPVLDPQTAVDGWGNRFSYVISENLSVKANYTSQDSLITLANHPNTGSGYSVNIPHNDIAYLLISHGPNGHGAYRDKTASQISITSPTNDDAENSDNDNIFSQSMPLAQYYDDIILSKTKWQLPEPIN